MGQPVTFLVDRDRPSYVEAAHLYREAFTTLGIGVGEESYPVSERAAMYGAWVLHHTIGPLFRPIRGAHNTAVVFHEWDRYPAAWVETLNGFDSVWAPSSHVAATLCASGVTTLVHLVPPPVAARRVPTKSSWRAGAPFRLLSIGEAHFRKGFHLLIDGFLRAFPREGEATLTLKVSPSCTWQSPRGDIDVVAERLDRDDLLSLYRGHDAYVSASLGEGFGLPVAEAVLAGLPVVANLWGGHRDIVRSPDCWEVGYRPVPQLFCSEPSYYAPGQCCAWSSAEQIAMALAAVRQATPETRQARALRARAALEDSHGPSRVAAAVGHHYDAIAADPPGVVAYAAIR